MGRGFFVALASRRGDRAADHLAELVASRIEAETDWTSRRGLDGLRLWTGGCAPLSVQCTPEALVIGDLFDGGGRPTRPPLSSDPRTAADAGRALARHAWGRYVALLTDRPSGGVAAFRDPSGFVECLFWAVEDGVHLVTSDFCALPPWLRPRRLAMNWDRIAGVAARPAACTTESLFDDIQSAEPGGLVWVTGGPPDLLWSPAAFTGPAPAPLQAGEVVASVDRATAALCGAHDVLLAELSGGLDSAIVAASVKAAGLTGRVAQWLNRRGGRPESDEQIYAQAVCSALGVELTAFPKPWRPLTEQDLRETARTFHPSVTAMDAGSDHDAVERLRATGATALLSGQGGDAVFFQMPSCSVLADAVRLAGPSALVSSLPVNVARRTRRSVWEVLAEASRELRGNTRAPQVSSFVTAEVRALAGGNEHAWVRAARARGVPPAKRLQIEAIANCHIYHDESRRAQVADLLFPLLAQPVVELCLSIPAPDLAGGAFDRPFARLAFADRLPEVVRLRRDKGNMSAFFGRLIAASLETLRPHLLDGCLAGAGVLDRVALGRLLDPEALMRDPRVTELLWAAALESWVRYWQGQAPDSAAAPRRR